MTGPRRVLVVFNPAAGWRRRERLERFRRALEGMGCAVELCETTGPGDATRIAARAGSDGFDTIAVAGGDGTINEAVNGLDGAAPPLAIVPLGTANVLAHELGVPLDMEACARVVAGGSTRTVHLGAVNGRRFTMMAGVGFDARVVDKVTPSLKRKLGKLAYVQKSLAGMLRYEIGEYELIIDGVATRAASAVVAKGHYYGGTFTCTPEARLDRPSFEVCLFRSGGGWNALRYAAGLVAGTLPRMRDIDIVTARDIRITGGATEPVQADGEIVATLPVVITIVPQPLSIIVPRPQAQ
jgi:YegS/Rv2252/BmrU family lipid kinase